MAKKVNRRSFLKSAGATGALATTAALMAQDNAQKTLSSSQELRGTEKLFGLSYTPEERAQVYDGIEAIIDRVKARRKDAPLTNADLPAHHFDPRVPGIQYRQQDNHLVLAALEAGPLPSDEDITFAPIWKQAQWLRSGVLTSARLTDLYLGRIQKHAPKLECFVTVMAESARQEAYQADRELRDGKDRGPLHGIPYGLKDLADTAGVKTTWGATPYKNRVADKDAAIVTRLREAGAVLLGKTTLGALAYGDLWFDGITRNPWDMGEGSSGSSAGSASATAAGLCSFAIGSETLGSIISPSGRCGTTGLRPTYGRISRAGCMTLCWSLDKLGPITRSVEDTALILAAANGYDEYDPGSLDWGFNYNGPTAAGENIRIGYDPAWFAEATASEKGVPDYLKSIGFDVQEIKLPDMPYGSLLATLDVEAAAAFEDLTLSDKDDMLLWQEPHAWPNSLRSAHFISAVEAIQVDRFRRKVMQAMAGIYEKVDIVVCPNFSGDMMVITNYTGAPSLTLPIGMEPRQSLPLLNNPPPDADRPETPHPQTITLWGNLFREDQLIAVGRLLEEKARYYEENRPNLD